MTNSVGWIWPPKVKDISMLHPFLQAPFSPDSQTRQDWCSHPRCVLSTALLEPGPPGPPGQCYHPLENTLGHLEIMRKHHQTTILEIRLSSFGRLLYWATQLLGTRWCLMALSSPSMWLRQCGCAPWNRNPQAHDEYFYIYPSHMYIVYTLM